MRSHQNDCNETISERHTKLIIRLFVCRCAAIFIHFTTHKWIEFLVENVVVKMCVPTSTEDSTIIFVFHFICHSLVCSYRSYCNVIHVYLYVNARQPECVREILFYSPSPVELHTTVCIPHIQCVQPIASTNFISAKQNIICI